MNILLINQAFYPDQSATARYLSDLALALKERGHNVTALTSREGYLNTGEDYKPGEDWNGIHISRVNPWFSHRGNKFLRILSAISMNLRIAARLIRMPKADVIIALTSPPLIAWVAACLAKKPTKGLIYWVMDLNPDQAVAAGWLKEGSLIEKLLSKALKVTFKRSKAIAVLDRFMAKRVIARGASSDKVYTLPLWSDKNLRPVNKVENEFRKQMGLESKFVVMYSGNFSVCHPVETILKTAESLKDKTDIEFLVIGGGARVDEVLGFISEKALRNIRFLPYEKPENLSNSLSAADIHLISFGDPYVGILHPSKIYGILAVNRPMILIGPKATFIYEECIQKGFGYHVEHGDVEGLCKAILEEKGKVESEKNKTAQDIGEFSQEFIASKKLNEYVKLIESI